MDKNEKILVSITVITYNSSKYVLETLESAKAQTYQNIELIVSDDYSTDNTVEICKNWIEKNKKRFVNTKLITVKNNTGISANINRGVKVAKGEWVKSIAGDDALLPDCIELNINYVRGNKNINVVQTNCDLYQDSFDKKSFIKKTRIKDLPLFKDGITASEQYQLLLRTFQISSPSMFLSKKVIENIGGRDEEMRLVEDWPFFIKITENNYKIYFLNETTVKYRKSSSSVTKKGKPYRTEEHSKALKSFAKKYLKGKTKKYYYYRNILGLNIIIILNRLNLNKTSYLSWILFKSAEMLRQFGK